jgi:hypothetical protein
VGLNYFNSLRRLINQAAFFLFYIPVKLVLSRPLPAYKCRKNLFCLGWTMFSTIEKVVLAMGLLRILSGSIEISVALLMLKLNSIEKALLLNSSLVLVGPIILILTTSIGLSGIAGEISYVKILLVFCGIGLILYAVLSK